MYLTLLSRLKSLALLVQTVQTATTPPSLGLRPKYLQLVEVVVLYTMVQHQPAVQAVPLQHRRVTARPPARTAAMAVAVPALAVPVRTEEEPEVPVFHPVQSTVIQVTRQAVVAAGRDLHLMPAILPVVQVQLVV